MPLLKNFRIAAGLASILAGITVLAIYGRAAMTGELSPEPSFHEHLLILNGIAVIGMGILLLDKK